MPFIINPDKPVTEFENILQKTEIMGESCMSLPLTNNYRDINRRFVKRYLDNSFKALKKYNRIYTIIENDI